MKPLRVFWQLAIQRILAMILFATAQAWSQKSPTDSRSSNTNIWQNGVGEGFVPGIQSISLETGVGYGAKILGSREHHDLALAGISYGYTLGSVEGEDHWYRGNWEFRGELISGAQFSPTDDWLVGLTPHLRYNFTTGTRWIPFVDVGAGVSATSIGTPDLSHYFGCLKPYFLKQRIGQELRGQSLIEFEYACCATQEAMNNKS